MQGTHLQEVSSGDEHHECVGQLLDPVLEGPAHVAGADARAALEHVHHEHAVVRQEAAALDDVVGAARQDGRADDARHPHEDGVVLLESDGVGGVWDVC